MNESLIRHLGVAILGHFNVKKIHFAQSMLPAFRIYRDDEKAFLDLIQNQNLKNYLQDAEIIIPSTATGAAALIALAIMYGEMPLFCDVPYLLQPDINDKLFNKLKLRLKIRRL